MEIKLLDILLKIKEKLESVYPNADMHFFNTTESLLRPSFLIKPIINMARKDNFYLKDKTLSIQIIGFMELEDNNQVGYETKLKLMDDISDVFGDMNLNVGDRNLKFECGIREIDGEVLTILDFRFKDDRKVIIESYELMEKVLLNKKEDNIYG